jgi:hypothetical protein
MVLLMTECGAVSSSLTVWIGIEKYVGCDEDDVMWSDVESMGKEMTGNQLERNKYDWTEDNWVV